jgi:hypothetical protein
MTVTIIYFKLHFDAYNRTPYRSSSFNISSSSRQIEVGVLLKFIVFGTSSDRLTEREQEGLFLLFHLSLSADVETETN